MNDIKATALMFLLIVIISSGIGFNVGLITGREDVASGAVICELTPFKKEWECMEKSNE